jgi:hypothetical protein
MMQLTKEAASLLCDKEWNQPCMMGSFASFLQESSEEDV